MPTTTITTSNQFTLNLKDVIKGLLVAVLTPVFTIIMTSLNEGELVFKWKLIGATALAAGLSYLLKNFLSTSEIVVKAPQETIQAVKDGDATVKVIQ